MAELSIGQIVISRQGKDAGLLYVVSGIGTGGRIQVIRPERFNVSRPKNKNLKHLQATSRRSDELADKIKAGNDIDAGYFHRSVGD
ncbi:MAG: hypothetical protein IJP86_07645 [Synergistaceae bacterium]|nr:hypothetical protein [Synergistaceae bacterium]